MKKIVILTTGSGNDYANRILQCIHYSIGSHSDEGREQTFKIRGSEIESFIDSHPELTPENVLFHARTAHPSASWMEYMSELEKQGFRFINNTSVLKLTSDKWQSYLKLEEIGKMPKTILITNRNINSGILDGFDKFIIKTRISQGNGAYVKLVDKREDRIDGNIFNEFPSGDLLVQDFLDIKAIYRTFCFGDFVLPVLTMDDNSSWKKSVCLNRKQTGLIMGESKEQDEKIEEVTSYALEIQQHFGGEINFIDIFELTDNSLVLSEINTACNLIIHENKTKVSISSYIAEYLIQQANL